MVWATSLPVVTPARGCPHHNERSGAVTMVVLHSDAAAAVRITSDWLADPRSEVSYHYSVERDGTVTRHVVEGRRAWHAGKSVWKGRDDGRGSVNGFSIGVNLSNKQDGRERYPEAQLRAAAALVHDICQRHRIALADVAMHSEVSPGRKADPAPGGPFDKARFLSLVAAAGVDRI